MITIRKASEKDAAQILQLVVPLLEEFVMCDFSDSAKQLFRKSFDEKTVINNMQGDYEYTLAEKDGRVIAYIAMYNYSHIYNLFVAKDFQRQGISRKLWNVAKAECIKFRCSANAETGVVRTIDFSVNASNYSVLAYEKLGFIRTSATRIDNGVVYNPMSIEVGVE